MTHSPERRSCAATSIPTKEGRVSAKSFECAGSGQLGGARMDYVGWCPRCKKIQRLRVGTGLLVTHWTANKEASREAHRY